MENVSVAVPVAVLTGARTPTLSLAGFGAAKHLSEQGYDVTLLDASPNPGGLSAGWRTPQGRAVEAGVKGFWYQVRARKVPKRYHLGSPHWSWGDLGPAPGQPPCTQTNIGRISTLAS